MIKKFNQYNESIRNEMVGKSTEDIIENIQNNINNASEDKPHSLNIDTYAIFELIKSTYDIKDDKELLKLLLDNNHFNESDIIAAEIGHIENTIDEYGLKGARKIIGSLLDIIRKKLRETDKRWK